VAQPTKRDIRKRCQETVGKLVTIMNSPHVSKAQSKRCYEMSRYMMDLASSLK